MENVFQEDYYSDKNWWDIWPISEDLKTNRNITIADIKQDCRLLKYASSELRTNKDVVLDAIVKINIIKTRIISI
jgi:hypothetical protein